MDYVESKNPELAELLRGTCADMSLNSTRGKPGVTFLMPQDSDFIKEVSKLAYSDKPADASKACNMLNALILRDVYASPDQFIKNRENIPNSLYPSTRLEVKKLVGDTVEFASGATAVIDKAFMEHRTKDNLAVWLLKGRIPHEGGSKAELSGGKKKGKTGSYQPSTEHSKSLRFQIARSVENQYALYCLQKNIGAPVDSFDPFCKHTLSLIDYIHKSIGNVALLHDKVLPLVLGDKIDFYLLVEPHRTAGAYLIDDATIAEWWSKKHSCECPRILDDIQTLLKTGKDALIYTDRKGVLERIKKVRKETITKIEATNPRECVEVVSQVYSELSTNNTIGGIGPVLPAGLAQIYKNEPALKMLQDDLRYYTYCAFSMLERNFDLGYYNELLNVIGECMYAASVEEMRSQQRILNKSVIKYMIQPSDLIAQVKSFVNSTMFLYVPMTREESAELTKSSIHRPDPDSRIVWNMSADIYTRHKRVLETSDPELEKLLASIPDQSVRDAVRARWKH